MAAFWGLRALKAGGGLRRQPVQHPPRPKSPGPHSCALIRGGCSRGAWLFAVASSTGSARASGV